MAKIVKMQPGNSDGKKQSKSIEDEDCITILRKAINGDTRYKEPALDIIDFFEHLGAFVPPVNDLWDHDDDNHDDDIPMTLPRKEVKEYHVRIKLNDIDIKIWREVKVPSNITLQTLAELLLNEMGWLMEHQYGFRFKNQLYCSKEQIEESLFSQKDKDYSQYTLSDLLVEKGVRMKLDYDYGDGWEHDVWVKGIREYEKNEPPRIVFVDGHGECPPEDCGGVWGYSELIKLTKKTKHTREEKERLKWYEMDKQSGFDPEYCDIDYCKDVASDYHYALKNFIESKKKR